MPLSAGPSTECQPLKVLQTPETHNFCPPVTLEHWTSPIDPILGDTDKLILWVHKRSAHFLNGKEKRIDFNDITHCLTRGPPSHILECAGILGALILLSALSALLFYPLAPEMVLQGFHPGFLLSSYILLTPSLQERIGNNNFTTLKAQSDVKLFRKPSNCELKHYSLNKHCYIPTLLYSLSVRQ